jgi:DNA-nicking Smr family endonuclease
VGDVEPVRAGKDRVQAEARPTAAAVRRADEDEEAFSQLAELVAGTGPFDLADSDEYVEGSVTGLDRKILRRLRNGDYAVQAHVDLHGMTRAEAKSATMAFIETARRRGQRCVLIVHGRGLHSKDQIPVLKESLQLWLTKGRIAREVLAFTTARPHDGGAGAAYVLLRR